MSLYEEIYADVLLLHSKGRTPRRIRVPAADRAELESDMRRALDARVHEDIPLHIAGLLVVFEGDVMEIECDDNGEHTMSQQKRENEGAFADQSAEGQSTHSEGKRNPDQGPEERGADDGDKGHDEAGSASRQGPVPHED